MFQISEISINDLSLHVLKSSKVFAKAFSDLFRIAHNLSMAPCTSLLYVHCKQLILNRTL